MDCPSCASPDTMRITTRYARFRHLDFATVQEAGSFGQCRSCAALFNPADAASRAQTAEMLRAPAYAQSRQTSQTVRTSAYPQPVTRSFLQAELLCGLCARGRPAILDIGCFDGALLTELSRRLPGAELQGFDVNEHVRALFPETERMRFRTGPLEQLDGAFDVICLSHSMQYIEDAGWLLRQIRRLLKPEGVVFLQLPDVARNPFALLFGDQYYYYTVESLRSVLARAGFVFAPMERTWFPRELVGIGRPARMSRQGGNGAAAGLEPSLRALDGTARSLRDLRPSGRLGVLGTTVNAAFADSILGTQLAFCVEENPLRTAGTFRGKAVVSPASLRDADTVVLPYGPSGRGNGERLSNTYRGRFICL